MNSDHMNSENDAQVSPASEGTSTPKSATKIKIIEDADATGETAAAYDFLRRVIEFGNTIHFSEGHLSRRYKELIASYVSYLNRCPY